MLVVMYTYVCALAIVTAVSILKFVTDQLTSFSHRSDPITSHRIEILTQSHQDYHNLIICHRSINMLA
jgi:hypothetical protein